jgi:hypothetical protein
MPSDFRHERAYPSARRGDRIAAKEVHDDIRSYGVVEEVSVASSGSNTTCESGMPAAIIAAFAGGVIASPAP